MEEDPPAERLKSQSDGCPRQLVETQNGCDA
eukprot:CAMPEP_0195024128 /NCGR_PEP_ID=MMETSP0326_2-20130528/44509_1 /TAXON_ID=2866 ORGANISM="Crypthecodinium cohnii, Strain Seligo" /NCGR_SAMPLE_ID=MMETSP0326_2 /ASSEMBLY_ACC=CAM_ASM_000348 /LENGTH=30 /DNA_ID= /DNA_START= /DNA_END= /DNA_ORIENTATION=